MERQLTIGKLKKVNAGDTIIVKGKVAQDAKRFAINLGQNDENLLIRFNPCFTECGCGFILCGSTVDGKPGPEVRFSQFPFRKGEKAEIRFMFQGQDVTVRFPDEITFKSKLQLSYTDYISVEGDFKVETIQIE